ncbi:nucleotidyltransferase family protein [uncultured Muriicola sp.]|uniref:nucleotidyltransferase family protein n=1 Tax=uncultured Muriicola sp. TaxID=1583102 RepID=UPI00262373CA|nr:nucleotidyltransferase family protein [uncultured Muriicola sp.]
MSIVALILAAGNSSRMGEAKQLLPWSQNTLLGNAIDVANNSNIDKTFVVLGAEAQRIQEKIVSRNCEVILNENWQEGLGSSISTGISGIVNSEERPDAVLIMLADQPFIDNTYINTLIGHYEANDGKIIATQYRSKMGVPAIFDKSFFSGLQKLMGDEGASSLILKNTDTCFSVDPGKKTTDLDTPEDYATFKLLKFKNKT